MKISIRGDKVEVTKSIKEYIEDKLSKLDKYFEKASDIKCSVIIRVKNGNQTIEVTIPTSKFTIRAEESHADLYAAVDLIIDKLERLIRKNKTKLTKHYKNTPSFEMSFDYDDAQEDEDDDEEIIVKRKNIDTKPMSEEEAILQMQLLNHDFFAFKNTDEECVSVLYLRKDNTYGIINVK
ncbi:MAG: ribosome-associated translation inhibitor RaiA [Firmicutes bacterium]|nr:ribosome-associated translation inhibitor RaiA [Bacillota bacterium]